MEQDFTIPTDPATSTTSADSTPLGQTERAQLRYYKAENERFNQIFRQTGVSPTALPPVAPVVPVAVPPSVDPHATADVVGSAVERATEPLRLVVGDLARSVDGMRQHIEKSSDYAVTEAGNRVEKVAPPTSVTGTEPKPDAAKPDAAKTADPDDELVYVTGVQMPGGRHKNGHAVQMPRREAEERGFSYRNTAPKRRLP